MRFWEMELAEIEATTSPEAMGDLWAEVLAGLRGAREEDLERLALKAQGLCAEERDLELRAYVENRIDEIVLDSRRGAERRRP